MLDVVNVIMVKTEIVFAALGSPESHVRDAGLNATPVTAVGVSVMYFPVGELLGFTDTV